MLQQSNLAHHRLHLQPSRHTCWGDIFVSPPGLLLLVRWTKTHQTVGKSPVLPIPSVPGHPSDPVAAFHLLLCSSPTTSPNHPLLTYLKDGHLVIVTITMLARALASLLHTLHLDPGLFSLHSLRRGRATSAYRQGLDPLLIKGQGLLRSEAFSNH